MKKICIIIAPVICAIVFIGCKTTTQEVQQHSDLNSQSAYERILKNNTIRVGYISYPPSLIKDPNSGQLSGIFYDVLEEIGKNMDLKIDFIEEVTWGTMIQEVNSGKVDIICTGIWPSSARGKLADFTNPIYFSPIRAYVKTGNTNFDGDLSKINSEKVKISVIDGEMTSIIANYDFPKAQLVSLTQSSDVPQVLLNVASGKAEVTFVEPIIANQYLQKNPNTIREVANVKPLRVFPNVMMVGKGEGKLLSTLNTSIEELANNGYIEKIVNKYETFPNSFYRKGISYIK
jgi:polar amino acid transport system substrate-binding protein